MGTVTSRLARARATLTELADGKADMNTATEGARA